MTEFLFQPETTLIGQTKIDFEVLAAWFDRHGFDTNDESTPAHRIVRDLGENNHAQTLIEFAGRQCYRSFKRGRHQAEYIENIIGQNHGSVLEHAGFTFAVTGVSRSLTHELIRHRVGISISQESQRYVPADDTNFVVPPAIASLTDSEQARHVYDLFEKQCFASLDAYKALYEALEEYVDGRKRIAEAARSVLPNCVETRLVWGANARTLRHLFDVRGDTAADLEIRRWAVQVFKLVEPLMPQVCDDWFVASGQPYDTPLLRRRSRA